MRREESPPNPSTDPTIGRAAPASGFDVADAIADVFEATQRVLSMKTLDEPRVASALLDIALKMIPAESGTFYLADVNSDELSFAAVFGPKADALKKSGLKVKIGQGIVGFCALEGVCLSVSDIQKDPRYTSSIAKAIGHSPRDTLCASVEKDGRLFGAIQLINSPGGFDAGQMEILRYIGLTAASMLERIIDTRVG